MTLYKDKSILITDQEIIIKGYYFPFGQEKVIPWQSVKTISTEAVTLLNGKYRAWGMGLKPYWFNNQWRADKENMFIIDTGHLIKSAITPENFESAKKAIESKVILERASG